MPERASTPCPAPGCGHLKPCPTHGKRGWDQPYNQRRGSSTEQGYTSTWRRLAKAWLRRYPLCAICLARGITEGARVVDHILAHSGDRERFWDRTNWGSLCVACHSLKTRLEGVQGDCSEALPGRPTGPSLEAMQATERAGMALQQQPWQAQVG